MINPFNSMICGNTHKMNLLGRCIFKLTGQISSDPTSYTRGERGFNKIIKCLIDD